MARIATWLRRYEPEFRRVLVLFCCDGRYARYVDEFVEGHLRVEGADWLACPGGPAALGHTRLHDADHDALARHVDFLVEAHGTERIVLILHEDCSYYQAHLGEEYSAEVCREAAVRDGRRAIEYLCATYPEIPVEAYWQSATDTAVLFEALLEAAPEG